MAHPPKGPWYPCSGGGMFPSKTNQVRGKAEGYCEVCRQWKSITKEGRLRKHQVQVRD